MKLNSNQIRALQYIENSGTGATKRHFLEDHEPIGELLLRDLKAYYNFYDDIIVLNYKGECALKEQP